MDLMQERHRIDVLQHRPGLGMPRSVQLVNQLVHGDDMRRNEAALRSFRERLAEKMAGSSAGKNDKAIAEVGGVLVQGIGHRRDKVSAPGQEKSVQSTCLTSPRSR